MKRVVLSFLAILILTATIVSCKKTSYDFVSPPEQAGFQNLTSGTYTIAAPGDVFKIPVGVTTVTNTERTINFTVTSPTGAAMGTQYTLDKTSVVLAPGMVTDMIEVRGVQAAYQAGRKDTLIFTIGGAGVKPSDYNSTFLLKVQGI